MDDSNAIAALAALSQPTRLATFRLLVMRAPEGIAAGEIARLLDTPQNTMSTHLSVLARAGLVTSERHSRSIIYRASFEGAQDLVRFLLTDACGDRPEICDPIAKCLKTGRR